MTDNLFGKKLLILGGMQLHCDIIKKAQAMGIEVYVTDYNLPEKSPGKQLADKCFMESTTDVDSVVKLIKQEKIDGVLMGFADSILPYYGEICEKAGLPCYATREQFEVLTNKKRYKQILREYGVPTTEEYIGGSIEDIRESIRYPVIVKPADSSGAKGVRICSNEQELFTAYENALQFSKSGVILVERFIEGKEATVFWLIQDGEIYLTSIGNRHVKRSQGKEVIGLPGGYTFPSRHLPKYAVEIAPKVKKMLHDLEIKNGMLFMQCVVDDDVLKVYDLGLRLTGSFEYKIFDAICGYDILEMMIRFALTGKMGESVQNKVDPYLKGRFGWNISFLLGPGRIEKMQSEDEILRIPGVIDAVTSYGVGEQILQEERGLLKQICFRAIGCSDTLSEMKRMISEVEDKFYVLDENDEDLMLPVLNIDECVEEIFIRK